MKKFNLATLLLGAMLFLGLGATTASAAEAMKCGAEKKDAAKCGGEKKDEKKAMKCGSGKCGSK
jgi:hypothetical protein